MVKQVVSMDWAEEVFDVEVVYWETFCRIFVLSVLKWWTWQYVCETFSLNIKDIIRQGLQDGVYHPNNAIHQYVISIILLHELLYFISRQLFNWLWPKMLQIQLDVFVKYWNNHHICTQKNKPNMSGSTPRHTFTVPAPPTQDCKIPVICQVIHTLCSQILVTCEEAMRWVDDVFDVVAHRLTRPLEAPPSTCFSLGGISFLW